MIRFIKNNPLFFIPPLLTILFISIMLMAKPDFTMGTDFNEIRAIEIYQSGRSYSIAELTRLLGGKPHHLFINKSTIDAHWFFSKPGQPLKSFRYHINK